jgi:hypothetical protein
MFTKNIFARVSELPVMKTSKESCRIKVIWNRVDLASKIQTVKLLHRSSALKWLLSATFKIAPANEKRRIVSFIGGPVFCPPIG